MKKQNGTRRAYRSLSLRRDDRRGIALIVLTSVFAAAYLIAAYDLDRAACLDGATYAHCALMVGQ